MANETSPVRPDGSQSIARAVELLSIVADRVESGVRLSQIAEASGLHIATARRILQALVSEGLLAFDGKSKLYSVGPAIYSFAVKGNALFSRRELFMPALNAIAEQTQDTVMFSVRSGAEAVCLARREGTYPIRVMSLAEGSRRPLGAGSGSLAILAFVEPDKRADIIKHCAPLYGNYRLDTASVTKDVADARKAGFSFKDLQRVYLPRPVYDFVWKLLHSSLAFRAWMVMAGSGGAVIEHNLPTSDQNGATEKRCSRVIETSVVHRRCGGPCCGRRVKQLRAI